ncbi:MAG TPA: 50S ribosomal protein L9 [Vicinamibacteria bacterium]
MEVILREDVNNLGRRGDIVKVAEGYGRNFLLPRGKAVAVNAANKAMVEKEKKAAQARAAKEKGDAEDLAKRIAALRFVAPRKVGENEQLYGSVTSGDVADFLKAKGIELDKRKVQLEDAIKRLGDHEVKIRVHPDVVATLKVLVTKEG